MIDNVILNVYDLIPDGNSNQQSQQQQQQPSALIGFFSNVLKPLGFGAYHTSIDVGGFRYSYGAGGGITRTSSPEGGGDNADSLRFVPPNGTYRESIILGQTWLERGEINAIIQRMRDGKFSGDKYHMANRNCNHFSETFAMALILGNLLLEESDDSKIKLDTFPAWINRLARTGTAFGIDDGNVCNVVAEARLAAGCKEKVGWSLNSSLDVQKNSKASKSQKKELTESQKAALAKLKKGSSRK